ncbi:MAG TPA: hypothetical protein VEU29_00015 [Actinomycetota bacterium]|nr:hypothetical protein [Actinomycetota bacterium]
MNPLIKKVIAAVAVKEAIEKVQEMRRPKPSLWSRISPLAIVAAVGGALFYLNKSGKLSPMVGGVKDKVGGSASNGSGTASNGSGSWDGGSTNSAPSTTAPSPTV